MIKQVNQKLVARLQNTLLTVVLKRHASNMLYMRRHEHMCYILLTATNSIFENIVNIIDSSELHNWLIMVCMITIIMLSL